MIKSGALVISLDFEMMWGCHEWADVNGYGQSHIRNVRTVINRLTDMFDKYQIHATFATVGLIFCRDKGEALKYKPGELPSYTDMRLCPFNHQYIENISKESEDLYFAPDIIEHLKKQSNIEIGSHTFSHYYCWEDGQTVDQFQSDLDRMKEVAENCGVSIRSLVFPKNQTSDSYLSECSSHGIMQYRGNAVKYFGQPKNAFDGIKNRICRFFDAYVNIGGYTSIPYSDIDLSHTPVNIPASRFMRPFSRRLSLLEPLRLRRIKKEMHYAATHGELYHIWWHPHNFGADLEQNLSFLEDLLKYYQKCRALYNMQSYTMDEFVQKLVN